MNLKDSRGLPVSTESDAALESYERAAQETHGYFGNPLASLDVALAEDPDFAMAHALRALVLQPTTETGHKPWRRRATHPARGAARTVTGATPGARAS